MNGCNCRDDPLRRRSIQSFGRCLLHNNRRALDGTDGGVVVHDEDLVPRSDVPRGEHPLVRPPRLHDVPQGCGKSAPPPPVQSVDATEAPTGHQPLPARRPVRGAEEPAVATVPVESGLVVRPTQTTVVSSGSTANRTLLRPGGGSLAKAARPRSRVASMNRSVGCFTSTAYGMVVCLTAAIFV